MKFEKKFSRIRILDLDMIWDHDRYVKASPGSNLQSSNNGLAISDDLGRKSGIFWASKQILFKKRFWHFFEKYQKSMSRSQISFWNHSESIEHIRNMFPSYSYEGRISKSEKSFMHILLAFLKLIFKLNSLIKSLRKKIHFFKIAFSTSILQTYFGCVLSIQRDISDLNMYRFSTFFKKASKLLFVADFLTRWEIASFSSDIVKYCQTIIGNYNSRSDPGDAFT